MSEAQVNNERTTLDYLNEDCWRAVLQYVPVRDLIRTERASRRWQELVLMYLRGAQIIIESFNYSIRNACGLNFTRDIHSFECWAKKLGTSVVSTYCNSLESLAVIKEYCPNIQSLKIDHLKVQTEQLLPHNLPDKFKLLERVYFDGCDADISDLDVSLFIANKALKELKFFCCKKVTGLCFNTINCSNLQRFVLNSYSLSVESEYILSVIERFGELKELELIDCGNLEQVPLVLDKMPKLEYLKMHNYDRTMYWHSSVPLSRLTRLEYLSLSFQMRDWEVAEVIRCCQVLQTLELTECECLTPGVVAPLFQHASTRLETLMLDYFRACDDDLVALVRSCPQLEFLTVEGAVELTGELPARVAAARRDAFLGPLKLDLRQTNLSVNDLDDDDHKYLYNNDELENDEGLILFLDDPEDDDTEDGNSPRYYDDAEDDYSLPLPYSLASPSSSYDYESMEYD